MSNAVILILIIFLAAIAGNKFHVLTISGSMAAAVVGILIALGLEIRGLILLGLFFGTSSFWSKYKRKYKNKVEERLAKGSQRDWQQVVANGGAASVAGFFYYIDPDPLWIFTYCVLLAGANSDTWASEIGTLSKRSPISVRSFSVVPQGTSGAISFLGTFAGIAGSLLIAVFSYLLFKLTMVLAFLVFVFGFLGNIIDTLLGAYVQAAYKCPICGLETEKLHHCGQRTGLIRGFSFLNNDTVNFLSSFAAALIGIGFYYFI
jgi:uncharacterized protein (TIGR00297 family)